MAAWTVVAVSLALGAPQADEGIDAFEKKIRPVLADRCVKCHGATADKPKGDLRLDTRAGLLRGGDSGPAVVPGNPDRSLLIQAVRRSNADLKMPPDGALSVAQVADFVAWVERGAPYPPDRVESPAPPARGWSLRPLADPRLPPVKDRDWPLSPVDCFILAKLEAKGLTPAEPADKRSLLRRATFDLIGLPPAPEEIEAFLSDDSPKAFERAVERLLASPHYGERWGRHWLDVARYADSAGNATDFPVPQAYRYRNYVINAFNRDKPYDQFVREQIAGDLLPSANDEQKYERIVATGFIALSRRPGLYPEREPHLTLEDTIETLGRSILGLSLACARCHDHKFDPISAEDYYALYGIFQSTRYPFPGSEDFEGSAYQRDLVPLIPAAEAEALLAPWLARMKAIDDELERLRAERAVAGDARKRRIALLRQRPVIEEAFAVAEGLPADARVHRKGDPMALGPLVPRRFISVLGGQRVPDPEIASGRRQLAEWLVARDNPLTPRVMVNRIWQHHFGRGLVRTSDDFGARGSPPTHPHLLDYLASRFVERGWSVKEMHRLIVLSRTYQMSSRGEARNAEADPDADLLWRFRRRRLDAEALRDALLAVGGDLDRTVGGAHPVPPEAEWHKTSSSSPFELTYETRRRSVYLYQGRLKKNPYLTLFDGANPNASTGFRPLSTTPLQALFMMNDPFLAQAAEKLARRLLADRPDDPGRVRLAFELTFGRLPDKEEQLSSEAYVLLFREKLKATDVAPEEHVRKSWAAFAHVLFSSNEFAFVD